MSPGPPTTRFLLQSEISFCPVQATVIFVFMLFEGGGCGFYSGSNVNVTEKSQQTPCQP